MREIQTTSDGTKTVSLRQRQ